MKKILGILLMPFLFVRILFVCSFIAMLFIKWEYCIMGSMAIAASYSFFMSNCELMSKFTDFLIRIFKINVSFTIEDAYLYHYIVLTVNGKVYNLTLLASSIRQYDLETMTKRSAIYYYFFD